MNALPRRLLAAVACGWFALAPLRAELTWARTEESLDVKGWKAAETVRFAYANRGATPVRITQIATGCGCTAAKASRETVAPGESGEVTAEFHPAGKRGGVRIPIVVTTDDGKETTLFLAAQISEGVKFDSLFVYWRTGDARDPRPLRFTVSEPAMVELGELACTQPGFTATLRVVRAEAPAEYEITVTPPATGGPAFSAVTLRTKEGPEKVERLYNVLARTF